MSEAHLAPQTPRAYAAGNQVNSIVVMYAVLERILKECLDLIDLMKKISLPAGILIQAPSGMGKTLLIDMIRRAIAARQVKSEFDRCLLIRLKSAVDLSKMSGQLLLALGYPTVPRANQATWDQMIEIGMDRVRPEVILVDELQHICQGNGTATAKKVTDSLKVIMDQFNVPLIGVGERDIEKLPMINPQFTGRAAANFVLNPFEYGETWRQLIAGYASQMTLVDPSQLNTGVARLLHTASDGNMRNLKKILVYASMHAADKSDRKITLDELAKAHEHTFGQGEGRANPFIK